MWVTYLTWNLLFGELIEMIDLSLVWSLHSRSSQQLMVSMDVKFTLVRLLPLISMSITNCNQTHARKKN